MATNSISKGSKKAISAAGTYSEHVHIAFNLTTSYIIIIINECMKTIVLVKKVKKFVFHVLSPPFMSLLPPPPLSLLLSPSLSSLSLLSLSLPLLLSSLPPPKGAPALIEYKHMKFLIINNPTPASLPNFISVSITSTLIQKIFLLHVLFHRN